MERFGEWVKWPGGGAMPSGDRDPDRQRATDSLAPGLEVDEPAAFQRKMGRRKFRAVLGRLLYVKGAPFYPKPPELSARLDGRRCIVDYRLENTSLRRSRHSTSPSTTGSE